MELIYQQHGGVYYSILCRSIMIFQDILILQLGCQIYLVLN